MQRLPPHCSGGLNSLQWPPDISPPPRSYHRHYAVGLSIWDFFRIGNASKQEVQFLQAEYIGSKAFSVVNPEAGSKLRRAPGRTPSRAPRQAPGTLCSRPFLPSALPSSYICRDCTKGCSMEQPPLFTLVSVCFKRQGCRQGK